MHSPQPVRGLPGAERVEILSMRPLIGAILAGGRSTRMGRDKATLMLDAQHGGQRMMDMVAAALRETSGEDVVACSIAAESRDSPRPTKGYVPVIDLRSDAGPLAGIESLLASGLARGYLVCPCDVPCITPATLRMLLEHRHAPATVLRIAGRGEFEPLPARIAAAALPTVQRLLDAGQRSIWRLMRELPAAIVEIDAQQAAALRNINTPDDLNTL